ncbi:MAG: hypothetical protein GYA14_02215 [Ignavibacteria bacterium]|nr:hypothetical protein [Ignavibacteria bacterium]
MNKLYKVTNEERYLNAAIESIKWWIENMFLGEKNKCIEWNWIINDRVTKIERRKDGEWEKCEGAFLSQYYPSKDGYSSVKVGITYERWSNIGSRINKNATKLC